ncbi:MAG: C_GCAxxG_C_C family protein [Desulfobacterales bacterium]|nr:C_GCAxxG_C_C family protein [Desulfobacterales bacterium]
MEKDAKKKSKGYWGRRAAYGLLKNMNCALTTHEICQDMIGSREDQLLKALTGLEGGVVASGSTCGVVTGGALSLALMHRDDISRKGALAERAVLERVTDYTDWFRDTYGTLLCRERMGVDFYRVRGQLRYLLPGDRVGKCIWHLRGATRYLYEASKNPLSITASRSPMGDKPPLHCASAVLAGIREKTGVGDPLLEKMAFVFDGGVGFNGGICGALAGAIMGINQVMGMDLRNISYWKNMKSFLRGHTNLLVRSPKTLDEPFAAGRRVVERFRQAAGSTECRALTGQGFSDWDEFQEFISNSAACNGLFELAINEASAVILNASQ